MKREWALLEAFSEGGGKIQLTVFIAPNGSLELKEITPPRSEHLFHLQSEMQSPWFPKRSGYLLSNIDGN